MQKTLRVLKGEDAIHQRFLDFHKRKGIPSLRKLNLECLDKTSKDKLKNKIKIWSIIGKLLQISVFLILFMLMTFGLLLIIFNLKNFEHLPIIFAFFGIFCILGIIYSEINKTYFQALLNVKDHIGDFYIEHFNFLNSVIKVENKIGKIYQFLEQKNISEGFINIDINNSKILNYLEGKEIPNITPKDFFKKFTIL